MGGSGRPPSPPIARGTPADPGRSLVVVLAGLPASGKTTVAGRLHRRLGGVLIRSCDVYTALGIDLPGWVERTAGFTRDLAATTPLAMAPTWKWLDACVRRLPPTRGW